MNFIRYIGRRLLCVAPQLFGIILILMVKLIPGDPVVMMLGPVASKDSIEALRESMGFNKPIFEQFIIYFGNVLHGDFGTSWQTTRPVVFAIDPRMRASRCRRLQRPAWLAESSGRQPTTRTVRSW